MRGVGRVLATAAVASGLVGGAVPAGSLGAHGSAGPPADPPEATVPYDGRFVFLRIQYGSRSQGLRGFSRSRRGREAPWEHDRPRAEWHFARILEATTTIDAAQAEEAGTFVTLDDPDLFNYPTAYIVEVGAWSPSEAEVDGLREYLLKGGFLIVDDFRGDDIYNFEAQMQRVLPGSHLYELTGEHEIFDSFFHIPDPMSMIPFYDQNPIYLGIFEDDDPSKRLVAIVNYNNDLAEYWEYSDQGYVPIDLSNEAYKFGVNYIVYGMTH